MNYQNRSNSNPINHLPKYIPINLYCIPIGHDPLPEWSPQQSLEPIVLSHIHLETMNHATQPTP